MLVICCFCCRPIMLLLFSLPHLNLIIQNLLHLTRRITLLLLPPSRLHLLPLRLDRICSNLNLLIRIQCRPLWSLLIIIMLRPLSHNMRIIPSIPRSRHIPVIRPLPPRLLLLHLHPPRRTPTPRTRGRRHPTLPPTILHRLLPSIPPIRHRRHHPMHRPIPTTTRRLIVNQSTPQRRAGLSRHTHRTGIEKRRLTQCSAHARY